jgi:hypothetical protein
MILRKGALALALATMAGAFLASCSDSSLLETDPSSAEWSGTVKLVGERLVGAGETLTIQAGTEINAFDGAKITVYDGGKLIIDGTAASPVTVNNQSAGYWNGVSVAGSGSSASVSYLDWEGAPFNIKDGASAVITRSSFHDFLGSVPPVLQGYYASSVSVSRCHFWNYYEAHFYNTPTEITDSLFEAMIGDGIDFDNSPKDSVTVKNCTIRNSSVTNVDGIDFGTLPYPYGAGSYGLVDSCLIYGVADKGVSVGEQALGVTIKNTLIHHTDIGVASKDDALVTVEHCTIADCNHGFSEYQERAGMGGGNLSAANSLVWGNGALYSLLDAATLSLSACYVDSVPAADSSLSYTASLDSSVLVDSSDPFSNRADSDYSFSSWFSAAYGSAYGADLSSVGVSDEN